MFHTLTWLIWFCSGSVHDLSDHCLLSGLLIHDLTFLNWRRHRENRKFEILAPKYKSITSIVPTSAHYIDAVRKNEWKCRSWQVRSNLVEPRNFFERNDLQLERSPKTSLRIWLMVWALKSGVDFAWLWFFLGYPNKLGTYRAWFRLNRLTKLLISFSWLIKYNSWNYGPFWA